MDANSLDDLDSTWRVDVTDADIRAAKEAWVAARDGDATPARVDELYAGYERLVRTQARQIAAEFRRRHAHRTR